MRWFSLFPGIYTVFFIVSFVAFGRPLPEWLLLLHLLAVLAAFVLAGLTIRHIRENPRLDDEDKRAWRSRVLAAGLVTAPAYFWSSDGGRDQRIAP